MNLNQQSSTSALGRSRPPVTRRNFLRATVAAGLAATGVASLSACASDDGDDPGSAPNSPSPSVPPTPREVGEATLKLTARPVAAPYKIVADDATRAETAHEEAYAQALEAWMTENPGVTLEEINTDVWNKEAMVTAIAGGTAPAIYWADVLGNWSQEGIRQAFVQQLAADVTDLVAEHDLVNRMSDGARAIWERSWAVDGRYFGSPKTYGPGEVVHYRRDLVAAAGLPDPEPGWSWTDLRELAKALTTDDVSGIMFRSGAMNGAIKEAEGMDLLSRLPAPDDAWHWKYDYSLFADQWAAAAENIRIMRFEEKTAVGDVGLGDDPWAPRHAFGRGEIAMHINSADMALQDPAAEEGPVALANRLGLPIDEVSGIVMLPSGIDKHAIPGSSVGNISAVAFDPELSEDELVAAFSLHMHMIGDGLVTIKNVRYDQTSDLEEGERLRVVYQGDSITPILAEIDGQLPGTASEAWGENFVASIEAVAAMAPRPTVDEYIPTEENPGPGDEALNDMLSKWWYEEGDPDVPADLGDLSNVRNQQAASFSSSVSGDDFAAGAKEYFEAHAAYWQEHSPDFYSQMFEPWYDEHIKPVVG